MIPITRQRTEEEVKFDLLSVKDDPYKIYRGRMVEIHANNQYKYCGILKGTNVFGNVVLKPCLNYTFSFDQNERKPFLDYEPSMINSRDIVNIFVTKLSEFEKIISENQKYNKEDYSPDCII